MKSTLLETHASHDKGGGGGGDTRGIEWFQKGKAKETTPPMNGFLLQSQSQSLLELRLGISSLNHNNNNNNTSKKYTSCSEAKGDINGLIAHNNNRLFITTSPLNPSSCDQPTTSAASAFIHPWSLAARQKAAALEQASPLSLSRVAPPLPPPIVGWPPVRACRRNLVSLGPMKSEIDGEKDAKKAKLTEESGEGSKNVAEENRALIKPTMFVKVNMEGFVVGRKINLRAHDSYESLSRALQKMFTNFLSINYTKNSAEDEEDEVPNFDYILLYEDHEGDRMLVGDVPWELFISSVKRLYIAHSPKKPKTDTENVTATADEEKK